MKQNDTTITNYYDIFKSLKEKWPVCEAIKMTPKKAHMTMTRMSKPIQHGKEINSNHICNSVTKIWE